ncbi:87_t:CDS:1, partial [Racocetra persica]
MADALDTKLKYKRGTCFSCQKCLYCGVDLQTQKYKYDITKLPIEAIEPKMSNM